MVALGMPTMAPPIFSNRQNSAAGPFVVAAPLTGVNAPSDETSVVT
jgi:hypothetical protein